MPLYARGTVTVRATLSGPAPRLRAEASRRSSTAPMATMIVRVTRGKETIAEARTAASQVKHDVYAQNAVNRRPERAVAPCYEQQEKTDCYGGHRQGQ